jgi:CBS domain-containing protein
MKVGRVRLADIMSTSVIGVRSDLDAEAAWREMRTARIHHLVVIDEGRIAGLLSDRDLGGGHGTELRRGKHVADLMTPYAVVAAPDMHVRDAANLMRANTLSCLPVVDGKTLVGVVTVSDFLELLGSA